MGLCHLLFALTDSLISLPLLAYHFFQLEGVCQLFERRIRLMVQLICGVVPLAILFLRLCMSFWLLAIHWHKRGCRKALMVTLLAQVVNYAASAMLTCLIGLWPEGLCPLLLCLTSGISLLGFMVEMNPNLQAFARQSKEEKQLKPKPNVSFEKFTSLLRHCSSTCIICLEEFELHVEVAHLPCNHIFHTGCLDQWFDKHSTCPLRCNPDLEASVANVAEQPEVAMESVLQRVARLEQLGDSWVSGSQAPQQHGGDFGEVVAGRGCPAEEVEELIAATAERPAGHSCGLAEDSAKHGGGEDSAELGIVRISAELRLAEVHSV